MGSSSCADLTLLAPLPKGRTRPSMYVKLYLFPSTVSSNKSTRFTQQNEIVTVLVGEEEREFYLHKQMLIEHSPYFETCLKDCWNATSNQIIIKDISVEDFEILVDFMYTGNLPDSLEKSMTNTSRLTPGFTIYRSTDILMMSDLQNAVVDLMVAIAINNSLQFRLSTVAHLLRHGLSHTKLYKLVLEQAVRDFVNKPPEEEKCRDNAEHLAKFPEAFSEVLVCINKHLRQPYPRLDQVDVCSYHIHAGGERCGSKMTFVQDDTRSWNL